jgi:hypothetical protein
MRNLTDLMETYLMVLVHPFRIHQQFRYNLPIPNHEGQLYGPLKLSESLGISWIFVMVRGLSKLLLLNFFLNAFMSYQSAEFPLLQDLVQNSGISTYYFLLFSAALDIIFYPVGAIITTEFWSFVIRNFAGWLDQESDKEAIADQISVHALSSNLFTIIPFIGDMIQFMLYHFLLYAGLRGNLNASRSLAWVILLTPLMVIGMIVTLSLLFIFYLVG